MNPYNQLLGSGLNRKNDARPSQMLIFDNDVTGYRGLEQADFQKVGVTGIVQVGVTGTVRIQDRTTYSGISNSTVGTTNTTIFPGNINRIGFNIQNLNTGTLYVAYEAGCNSNRFHVILKKGTAVDDGLGGSLFEIRYTGIVSVSGESGPGSSPRYIAWEG